MDLQNNALFHQVMPIVLFTWNVIAAFSEECVANLVHGVLLLYLVCTRMLAISMAARVRRELQTPLMQQSLI